MRNGVTGRRDVLAALAGAALWPAAARAQPQPAARPSGPPVDVALLMAVDASASITKEDMALQLDGHAAAFRSPAVAAAIAGLPTASICASLVLFSGPDSLATLVPWTVVANAGEAQGFAAAIDAAPGIGLGGPTALGSAVVDGVGRLAACPRPAARKVIDLVSNGFNNAGVDPRSARGYAEEAGVTVNALVILDDYDWLEAYFQDSVITPATGFVRVAESRASFAQAFLAKVVAEIA
jgi:hypothetical protein